MNSLHAALRARLTGRRKAWRTWAVAGLLMSGLLATAVEAQRWARSVALPRGTADGGNYPQWELPEGFKDDAFTFARVRFPSVGGGPGRTHRWDNDYPDSDMNFSFRLQQMTSIKVSPESVVIEMKEEELADHPFVYMVAPGRWVPSRQEAEAFGRYLLNGGFVMMDDFWSRESLEHIVEQMKMVLPGREPVELHLDHLIFRLVFDLKEKPQVTDIHTWLSGLSYEIRQGGDMSDPSPRFYGYFDDRGFLVALLCHNNDLGDGWEREGENEEYFRLFAEPKAYPMGINILIHAMTQ